MDLRKLKTLIDLVSESNVSELEITEAEGKVRIVKSVPTAPAAAVAPAVASAPIARPVLAPVAATPLAPSTGHTVSSPMVGTFYRAPNPDAEPFVQLGTSVKVGDRLCIIEAMKILNEIEADRAGVVQAILVQDGEAVEYGQALFTIEPAAGG